MKSIGRILWAVIEFLWYPALLTTGIWALNRAGFFSGEDGQARGGMLVIGVMLWKLAKMIARVELHTQIQLILAFCWCVGYLSFCLIHRSDVLDLHASREAAIAMAPLFMIAKRVITEESVAPAWIMRWIERRKAGRDAYR